MKSNYKKLGQFIQQVSIKNSDFVINPKKLGDTLVGCEYCPFGDICYKNENNIIELKEHKDLDFLGGENNDTK